MNDPFFLSILKHPFSFPSFLVLFFIFLIIVVADLTTSITRKIKAQTNSPKSAKLIILSLVIFLSSCSLLFYKLTEIPPAGLDIDDAMYVVGGYFLKNLGYDSRKSEVPYYALTSIKYHKEVAWDVGQRALPVYIQTFLLYFLPPGFFSLRLESTIIMIATSIILIYTMHLLTEGFVSSLLFGALVNVLPWTRILARVTPESTAYCFGAACFLFSFLYLLKKKNLIAVVFYLLSLIIFFMSYTPAVMFAPLCAVAVPFIGLKYSKEHAAFRKTIIVASLVTLSLVYLGFKNEEGYKYNLGRANVAGCLEGLNELNVSKMINGLLNKWSTYAANYIGYYMPQFLFTSGDFNLRHNTSFGGQLFASLAIAFYLGFFYLIEKRKESVYLRVLLIYLLISAIPYSICMVGGLNVETKLPLHALRSSCILPIAAITIFIGLINIARSSKALLAVYLLVISVNILLFYKDYFTVYPVRLGNYVIDDPGLRKLSTLALGILEKDSSKKLFYRCTGAAVVYHNIEKIGIGSLFNGDGILSNIYFYEYNGKLQPKSGDLLLVQEPFDYHMLGEKFKFVSREKHPYIPGNPFGASLLEITED